MNMIIDALQQLVSDNILYIKDTLMYNIIGRSSIATSSPFSLNSIIGYFISGLIGLMIGIIYSLFFESKVRRNLSRILPKIFRKKLTLDGTWEQNWFVESSSFPRENKSNVILKQRKYGIPGFYFS